MNNKYNIGDKVIPKDKNLGMYKDDSEFYSWYEVWQHENGSVDTYPEGNIEYSWAFNDSEIELIEQNTIEEEKQDNKQLKKFNKGDKVKLTYANEVKRGVIFNVNEYDSYDVVIYGEDGFTTYDAEWIELIELDTQEGETEEKIEMPEGRFVYKVNMNEFLDKAEYIHFEDLTVMKVDIKYMSVDLVVKDIIQGTFGKGIILVLEDETEFHLSYQNDDACYKDFRQAQKQLYPKVSELI